ncbi:MAG TPA: flagellar basal body-associated FliL family protein [Candidatus Acidoferrum sp.]|nr:flagellar basal body-associated FliL family protein [Candidatus Acidoferrum sp.]
MSDQPEAQPKPAAPPGPKTSKLLPLLLLVNLGGTGYGVYQGMQLAGAVHAVASAGGEHGEKDKDKDKEKAGNEVGPVTPLDPFIVNLNEPEAGRYLKASFELEVAGPEVIAQLEKLKRPVRDELLRYLSSLSVADTAGEAGKAKIQKEVVARIDQLVGGGNKVRRLFFVEFVVQ